jgi:hypothetical protein
MKKIILPLLFLPFFVSCESNVEEEIPEDIPCNFQGRTYVTASILLDISFDLDGDGIYTNDIVDEDVCYTRSITFDVNDSAPPVISDIPSARIDTDANGNLVQLTGCSTGDGANSQCFRDGDTITLKFNGNVTYTGVVSENGNVLTFELPNRGLFTTFDILNQDGSVTQYEGGATVRFELE